MMMNSGNLLARITVLLTRYVVTNAKRVQSASKIVGNIHKITSLNEFKIGRTLTIF